jgi:ribosomal protein L16 Arg81 hydroxylase
MEMYSTCQPLIDVRENQDLVLEREVRLLPGDVMYFPRGFIHEARTTDQDSDSLHFTLTLVYDTWNGYFSKIVLESLSAIHSCEDFRNLFPHLMSGSNDFKLAEQLVYQKFIDELKSRLISSP